MEWHHVGFGNMLRRISALPSNNSMIFMTHEHFQMSSLKEDHF